MCKFLLSVLNANNSMLQRYWGCCLHCPTLWPCHQFPIPLPGQSCLSWCFLCLKRNCFEKT